MLLRSMVFSLLLPSIGLANSFFDTSILTEGFSKFAFLQTLEKQQKRTTREEKRLIRNFCSRLNTYFASYDWEKNPCGKIPWQVWGISKNNHPLIFAKFGNGDQTTLLLGGVHPDELTPVPMGFRLARHLAEIKKFTNSESVTIIVAPLVNPDGFLRNIPTRTNANGVDPNRNFLTHDWYSRAIAWWINGKRKNPRHFPGYFPNTEIETLFQVHLIKAFRPDKIISIHAPLGFLDYDGPGDRKPKHLSNTERNAKRLVESISEKTKNYRIVDYSFYPGSLGNFAGNERKVPTVTLELQTTNPKMVESYWRQFLPGLIQSIEYPFKVAIHEQEF